MARQILAGDIGGTKTNLAIYAVGASGAAADALTLAREASFPSRQYGALEDVVRAFLQDGGESIEAAAFGIAGPVVDDAVRTTNLPWHVTVPALQAAAGCTGVRLLNDLEATAYGSLFLPPARLHTLHRGHASTGNRAVIAAGTGLGEAFLAWDGKAYHAFATEGGHVDLAPSNDFEIGLLQFLRREYPDHVSYERVVSGPGLRNMFRYLHEDLRRPVAPEVLARLASEDPSAVIGELGVAGTCPTCTEAVDRVMRLYGAQAGNLALTVMATGGVYVGGGIVTKLLPRITSGTFLDAFRAKGRYAEFMAAIPVHVILEPKTALLGAAHAARGLLG